MNKARRKTLDDALAMLHNAEQIIGEVLEEEEMAYDNLPESIQDGERGEAMQEAIDSLDDAMDQLAEVISGVEEAQR